MQGFKGKKQSGKDYSPRLKSNGEYVWFARKD